MLEVLICKEKPPRRAAEWEWVPFKWWKWEHQRCLWCYQVYRWGDD